MNQLANGASLHAHLDTRYGQEGPAEVGRIAPGDHYPTEDRSAAVTSRWASSVAPLAEHRRRSA